MTKSEDVQGAGVQSFLEKSAARGAENRTKLSRLLSRLVQSEGVGSHDLELDELYRVLNDVIHSVEFDIRKKLAQALSTRMDCPKALLRFLSNDHIDIAAPVILRSPILQETELLEIVRLRTLEHRLAMAQRAKLPARVAEAIIEMGEEEPILMLLHNKDTSLRNQAMEYLVEQSQRYTSFQQPLVHRAEMTKELALQLAAHVSAVVQQAIMDRFNIDEDVLNEAVRAIEAATNRELSSVIDEWGKSDNLVEMLIRRQKINVQSMANLLETGETALFIAAFKAFTGVPKLLARRILFEDGGEALAVTCKAIGMSEGSYQNLHRHVAKARLPDGPALEKEAAHSLDVFRTIPLNNAKRILEYWQNDKEFLVARHAVRKLMAEHSQRVS